MARVLYGPPIQDAIARGDVAEMKSLVTEAEEFLRQHGDVGSSLELLKLEIVRREGHKTASAASLDGRKTKAVARLTTIDPVCYVCDTRLRLPPRLSDGGLQHLDGLLGGRALTSFERDKLRDQMSELAGQRIHHGRRIVRVQLTTDCG